MQPQYEITQDDRKRQERIAEAWKAYNGELDPPLVPMPNQPDDNTVGNYIEDKIDAMGQFLFGKEVGITCEEGAPKEAQDFLDLVWGRKEKRIPLLQKLHLNGAVTGQAFLRIVPGSDGSFRLVVVDPATVFVQTAPQDCEVVNLFCIEYCCQEQINGIEQEVYYREEMQRYDPQLDDPDAEDIMSDKDTTWIIQHWTRIGEKGGWEAAGEPIVWPYPFAPIFSCQNMPMPCSFWGKPDITKNLIQLNKALNLNNSNVQKLGRIYSHPLLYASGVGLADVDHTPGRITILPTPESEIAAVNVSADIPSLLSAADRLQSRIDEQTGVPGIATGRASAMPGGNMSGIAIELLFMSIIKRNDMKRCLYGELMIDVSLALLVLNKMSGDIEIEINWQNPLPNDDTSSFQAALLAKQIGVSDQTLLEERGYDPEQEMERNQNEDAQKMINFSRGQGFPPAQPQQGGDQGVNSGQDGGNSPFLGRD
jgi:hypothetical protein